MPQEKTHTRRSILRSSGKALAATTVGLATVGTASADDHFAPGVRVFIDADGNVPCWVGESPCGQYEYYYEMPPGSEAYCKSQDQDLGCGTYVEVNDLDFNVKAWVNTNFLQVVG